MVKDLEMGFVAALVRRGNTKQHKRCQKWRQQRPAKQKETREVGTKVCDNSGAEQTGESFKGLNKGCVVDFASRAL